MSDRSDYEHCCPNSGPSFDCGVVQALRERVAELEAENQRLHAGIANAMLCDSVVQMHECLAALMGGGDE